MIQVAFCNDCDRLVWDDFLRIHSLLDELQLPAGESFWLFDPLDISDMSLFRNDTKHKAKNHDRLIEQLQAGRVDVLHGVGLFGKTGDDYVYPNRDEIRRAFDYLAGHGVQIRVYVCHGNDKHKHNIPARPDTRRYQSGDLPYSGFYILDIAKEYGIEYFWISELQKDLRTPFRVLHPASMPSGETIQAFRRFGAWGTGAHNIPDMLNAEVLGKAIAMEQNLVLFTHWGMKGVHSPMPEQPLLHRSVISAFTMLSRLQAQGKVRVVPLTELLDNERARTLPQETDRIAGLLPKQPGQAPGRPAAEYSRLVRDFGVSGDLAVDATGDEFLAVFLAGSFGKVLCVYEREEALARAHYLSEALALPGMMFHKSAPAQPPLADNTVDALFLRASSLESDGRVLQQAYRILKPGMPLCLFLDTDKYTPTRIQDACMRIGFKTCEWAEASSEQAAGAGRSTCHMPRLYACK
ncbi:hypothetical protein DPQ33_15370 [Oceanidesulfovibrio indonesiensis]|uniref:Uncharacterized protein n=1 Tax=Oceanidesulfovibrio indonesiensis TaxID=54767 RepID=A0A7M3MB68_9BACT|nr:class I SAM-dependent methyltransferase [Oceanidesulfovibrio indonesiensis]TVM15340.1 hypothetical protein DPQ33_15370 [Oceanidesulfovibrio indonesiensis]